MIPFLSMAMPGQAASAPASSQRNTSGLAFEAIVASMLPVDGASLLQPGLPGAPAAEAAESVAPGNLGHEIPGEERLDAGVVNQLPALQGPGMFTAPAPTGEIRDMPVADPDAIQQLVVAPGQAADASVAGLVVTEPHAEPTVTKQGSADTEASGELQPSGVHAPIRSGALSLNQAPATNHTQTGSVAPVIIRGHEATPTPGTIQPSVGNPIRETSSVSLQASATAAVTGEIPAALSVPNTFGEPVTAARIDAAAVPTIVSGLVTGDARPTHGYLPLTATETQVLTDPAVLLEIPVPGATETATTDEAPAMLQAQTVEPENALTAPAHGSISTPTGALTPEASPANKLGVEATSGGKALAVESVVSRGAQEVPLNRQLLGPIASLATGPHGDRTLSINIAPDALGPVTVKAHLGSEGLRVELTAPTDAGRDALRAMLPELRRDLAATGTGTVSIGTASENGSSSGGGNPDSATDQRFATPGSTRQAQARDRGEIPVEGTAPAAGAAPQQSTHLDVMA